MNPESDPHKVDTPYGPLYLAVMPAKMERFWVGDEDVTTLRPWVRVATDPAFEADPAADDHFTIRGRAWAVHRTFYFHDKHISGNRWHMGDAPSRGGYRNANRQPIAALTPTWDKIHDAVTDALDAFAETLPEWTLYSEFLYWNGKEDAARAEALRLLKEQQKAAAEAFDYMKRADALQHEMDVRAWERHHRKTTEEN